MAETVDTKASQGSPFWRFSLAFYRAPGVGEACIALQDGAGVDVNLLLFLLWQATRRQSLSAAEVAELERQSGPWREAAVVPLRDIRRALKSPPGLLAPAAAEAFRTRIKAVELEAERLQQEALYERAQAHALGQPAASAADAARANIEAYQTMLAKPFAPANVATLLAAFTKIAATD
jgi:uncharacterized protein (TIGR02444 family)